MRKLMKILPVMLMVCLVATTVFADIGVPSPGSLTGDSPATNVQSTANNMWSTVITIVQILAVGAVVFAGLRYMFASADQKADIKKSMGILAVGAILVFAATTILTFVQNAATTVIK